MWGATEGGKMPKLQQQLLTVGQKRELASELRVQGMSYAEIGAAMKVSAIKARDLCKQFERCRTLKPHQSPLRELSGRAVFALLEGQNAQYVASPEEDFDTLLTYLVEIAASYERSELLEEPAVGVTTCNEIEVWLATKGRSFRPSFDQTPHSSDRLEWPSVNRIAHSPTVRAPDNARVVLSAKQPHATPPTSHQVGSTISF
jgi:hypothetical protein